MITQDTYPWERMLNVVLLGETTHAVFSQPLWALLAKQLPSALGDLRECSRERKVEGGREQAGGEGSSSAYRNSTLAPLKELPQTKDKYHYILLYILYIIIILFRIPIYQLMDTGVVSTSK